MEIAVLWIFALACVALAATPGPDMLLIAARSASHGRAAGFATLAGIQIGTYGHALATALGLAQLFAVYPLAYDIVRYAGAAYLAFLAVRILTAPQAPMAPSSASAEATTAAAIAPMFRQGLWNNVLNPKMALFVVALFPQFVDPAGPSIVLQMLLLATILNAIGLVVNGAVIIVSARAGRAIAGSKRAVTAMRWFLACVFAGLALRLVLDARR
ncbi:MAG: LysE family translocator [Rhodospirillales bacterium]